MSLRERLQQHTHEAHQALHVHPLMRDHFFPRLEPASYGAFLAAFLAPWRWLDVLGAPGPSKTALLVQDLAGCGWSEEEPAETPASTGRADLGVAYVLYGASMGAVGLRRHVVRHLPNAPTAFLSSGKAPWQALQTTLLDERADGPAADGAMRAASRAFRMVSEGMDRGLRLLQDRASTRAFAPSAR